MTRMRHPRPDVTGEIDIPDEAVSMHRMTGWLTEEENPDLFVSDSDPEDADADDSADEEPEESGGQTKRPRRARSRATSEKRDED
jgi:hypothetical protein